ncbi:N-acetylmuramoyl-L-alanine amidase CwlD [Hathewaya massiliensis]|uniref:N-acetylmuramoyl-L-alanine amidase CwlD n=1 Tax=Hathewaya massiliensis TaxID=1964382 RepID=UPI003C12BBF2
MIKNKKLLYSILVLLLCITSIVAVNYNAAISTMKTSEEKSILIDAGHGGIDGGAVSPRGTIEKDLNLKIALYTKEELEKQGFKVYMTREEDRGLYDNEGTVRQKKIQDLNNRCKMKEEKKPDIFLSIHMNKFPEEKYSGAQVWYSRYKDSKKLAEITQKNLKEDLNPKNNRVQKEAKDQFKILRSNDDMASIIVECGFISNYEEETKLKSEEYQRKIAKTLCKSILEYYKER